MCARARRTRTRSASAPRLPASSGLRARARSSTSAIPEEEEVIGASAAVVGELARARWRRASRRFSSPVPTCRPWGCWLGSPRCRRARPVGEPGAHRRIPAPAGPIGRGPGFGHRPRLIGTGGRSAWRRTPERDRRGSPCWASCTPVTPPRATTSAPAARRRVGAVPGHPHHCRPGRPRDRRPPGYGRRVAAGGGLRDPSRRATPMR